MVQDLEARRDEISANETLIEISCNVLEDVNLQTERVCRLLNVSRLKLESRIVRVQEHGDQCGRRNQVAQQPEPFRLHHGNEKAGPCRVASGPIKAGDEAKPDWVVAGNEDDQSSRSLPWPRARRRRRPRSRR